MIIAKVTVSSVTNDVTQSDVMYSDLLTSDVHSNILDGKNSLRENEAAYTGLPTITDFP